MFGGNAGLTMVRRHLLHLRFAEHWHKLSPLLVWPRSVACTVGSFHQFFVAAKADFEASGCVLSGS
jgi:hypothetical protein